MIDTVLLPISPLPTLRNAYYRSTVFTTEQDINPLINAAAPLLALAGKLSHLLISPDLGRLYHDLVHEIKAYENKAQHHNYHSPTILAGRFALCGLLDEIILNTRWGKASSWREQNLLNTFQPDDSDSGKFFLMVQRICEDPALHIDLLELLYLCISLGFSGKYRHLEHGDIEITQLLDELYKIIQQQRGEFSQRLTLLPVQPTKSKLGRYRLWPTIIFILSSCCFVTVLSFTLNYTINHQVDKLLQQIHSIEGG